MKKTNKILLILTSFFYILIFNLHAAINFKIGTDVKETSYGLSIRNEYGKVELDKNKQEDALLIQLIEHPVIKRLKSIHQYGPSHFVKKQIVYAAKIQLDYTRWEHSIGVFVLLRMFGATLEEQIAGLFHDSSHTVLSHVGCVLFKKDQSSKTAYQDDVLKDFLTEHGIETILEKQNIPLKKILIENVPALKKSSPELCADNLEYTLKGGLLAGFIKPNEIQKILSDLHLDNDKKVWYFSSIEAAEIFASASVKLSQINSGSRWNAILYKFTALAIQRSIEIGLLSKEDIIFNSGDDDIWKKLALSQDSQLAALRECIVKHEDTYQILEGESDSYDCLKISTKFRGINPWVKEDDKAAPAHLTELSDNFKKLYYGILYQHQTEATIRFVNGYALLASAINALGGIKGQ